VLLKIIRVFFVLGAGLLAWVVSRYFMSPPVAMGEATVYAVAAAAAAAALVIVDIAFRRQFLRSFVAVVFGVIGGLLVSGFMVLLVAIFILPTIEIPESPLTMEKLFTASRGMLEILQPVVPLITLATCYLTVSVVLRTKDEFRFVVPYVDFAEQGRTRGGLILDSSVLIDGRIVEVAEKLLLNDPLIVPRFVIDELQHLADRPERLLRARGRRGLDMVGRLQGSQRLRARVHEDQVPGATAVDAKLVRLTAGLGGRLVTNDFNLAKVARIENVPVVSINDLAGSLRAPYLPGETLSLRIVRRGEEKGQGVGYLDDGTMVVVEDARGDVGQEVTALVTSSIQTSAGRMIFGRKAGEATGDRRDAGPEGKGDA
jgi:uncharacterized protein YacL